MSVAPYVGAWIETHQWQNRQNQEQSHPTWVRGLKHNVVEAARYALGRTLHGCVD